MGRNPQKQWGNYNRMPNNQNKYPQAPPNMTPGYHDPFKEYYEYGNQQMGKRIPNYNPQYMGRHGNQMDYMQQKQYMNQKQIDRGQYPPQYQMDYKMN